MKRRSVAVLLGALTTLLIFEGVLRVTGAFERQFWQVEGAEVKSNKPLVLFVGNSHTMGSGAPKEKSFPNQLLEKLKARNHGDSPFEIVNVGRGNANSSFIAETLPGFLRKYKPAYVVVMTGETNQWNHYGYAQFAAQTNHASWATGLYDLAYHARIFRFAQLFSEFVVKPRESLVFSSQDEQDRALYWIAALDSGNMFDIAKMSEPERAEALHSLETFLSLHPNQPGALMATADLRLAIYNAADRSKGLSYLKRAYDLNQGRYNFRMDRILNIDLPRTALQPAEKAWADKIKSQRPENYPMYVEYFEKLRAPSAIAKASVDKQVEFYSQALAANPTNSIARTVLYSHQFNARKFEDAIRTLADGADLNPFANMMDWYASLFELRGKLGDEKIENQRALIEKIDVVIAEFKTRYPRHADAKKIVSRVEIDRWLESDLVKIFDMVRGAQAQLMLQTYMPEKNGFEKPADAVIRKFAAEKSVPLSDTFRYFVQIEPDAEKRKRFFTTWYGEFDNHLGENGYALVADLLELDFEKFGWISPR